MKEEQRGEFPKRRPFAVADIGMMLLVDLTDLGKSVASEIDLIKPGNHLLPDPQRPGYYTVKNGRGYAIIPPSADHPTTLIRSVKEVQEVPLSEKV